MSSIAPLLHPVRLRIVRTFRGDDGLTTRQLAQRLPDVPPASLYRHIAELSRHGVLLVVEQGSGRGAERTYQLALGVADNPSAQPAAELVSLFTAFALGLAGDVERYAGGDHVDLVADQVAFTQEEFWASNAEVVEFVAVVQSALERLLAHAPDGDRRRRALSTVLHPVR